MELNLSKYAQLSEEKKKLDTCLEMIGAMAIDQNSYTKTKIIRVEVLLAAMRIHGYFIGGLNLIEKIQGVDLRTLTP